MKRSSAAAPYRLSRVQRRTLLEANRDCAKRGEAASQVICRLADLGLAVRLTGGWHGRDRQGLPFNLRLTDAGVALAQEIETGATLRKAGAP